MSTARPDEAVARYDLGKSRLTRWPPPGASTAAQAAGGHGKSTTTVETGRGEAQVKTKCAHLCPVRDVHPTTAKS